MEKKQRRFMSSKFIQDPFAVPLARIFIAAGISANMVTCAGIFAAGMSGFCYLNGSYNTGAVAFFVALVLDSTDGRVARATNTFSSFGAKLDAIADKTRSFVVAACFLISLNLELLTTIMLFVYYLTTPLLRATIWRDKGFGHDPAIVFWDSMPIQSWLAKHKVFGPYTGWERSIVCLLVAPISPYPVFVFVTGVVAEQIAVFGGCLVVARGWRASSQ